MDGIEDALVTWVKDMRQGGFPVCRGSIRLLPGFLADKTEQVRLSWCDRFMKRSGLTIRRVSHSGRKTIDELTLLKDEFAMKVTTILIAHFLDAETGVPPPTSSTTWIRLVSTAISVLARRWTTSVSSVSCTI